jgi:CheY-like chemotaxis protein
VHASDDAEFGPVPLLLGVVGHRELPAATGELRSVVREILLGFRRRYPSTRIVLLSALAEGADRLAAREALDLGCSLVVPLPFEPEEYERDFAGSESRAQFRDLLGRAESWFVVPGAAATVTDRPQAYAACGAYIARRCVELIALWDGRESPVGGTGHVVSFQLDGIPAPYVPAGDAFDQALCGPVVHVMTPRGRPSDGNAALQTQDDTAFPVTIRYPTTAVVDPAQAFARAEYDLERFNRDVTAGPFARCARGLPVRRQAEVLATAYQRRTTSSLLGISASVFLAVIAFNLYVTIPVHPLSLLAAYAFFSAAAFAPYVASRRGEWQLRYQDYRALEQVLRTGEYWQMAGIERSVASQFARSERTKVDWIALALGALTEPLDGKSAPPKPLSQKNLRAIYEEWVVGQQRYFTQFAGRRERVRERASSRIVTAGVVFSVALTVGSRIGAAYGLFAASLDRVLLVATVSAVLAALVHDYAEKRGWTEHSRHYELMAALFGYAAARIAPILAQGSPDESAVVRVRAILMTLGDEAIRETLAWLNLHRSRPLSVPRI